MSKLNDAAKITLGADPEFCFIRNGHLYAAGQLMGGDNRDPFVDEDDDTYLDLDGEFGVDGCDDIAELRPKPSSDPYVLVENIRSALNIGYTKVPELKRYKWLATPAIADYSMGGHIHLGFRDLPKGAFKTRISNRKISNLLDLYLAVPAILVEPHKEADWRRSEYGEWGDYRAQPWGMEYRVLSTWLSHPAVALSVLCLAKTVAVEGLMHGQALTTVSAKEHKIISALYENDSQKEHRWFQKELLPTVFTRLTKFELYPTYKEEIGFLFDMIHANKSTMTKGMDMKAAWGLEKLAVPKPKIVKPKLSELFVPGKGLAARLSAAALLSQLRAAQQINVDNLDSQRPQ